mgnify:CR=1 FL=1
MAPMAGATDTTMRRLCAAHGAVCTVSEMVSAKALTMGDKKSPRLMAGGGGDAPFGVQLFGAQPDVMAEAARLICDMRGKMPFDFIDINMGCPVGKVVKSGEQIVLGGNESYVALCRKHWQSGELAPEEIRRIADNVHQALHLRLGEKLRFVHNQTIIEGNVDFVQILYIFTGRAQP